MECRFDVKFPLVLEWDGLFSITFTLKKGNQIAFTDGIYYLEGDNGSGKTTFLNLLSLTAGEIGGRAGTDGGGIFFNGTFYGGKKFGAIEAAKTREQYFCVFPQKAFFLPVSTRDNYLILNGSDSEKALSFSNEQLPDLLSGGQQQKALMEIVLDEKRPVWFLDEPLTNLDVERRLYFWTYLKRAFKKNLRTIFFIDHQMKKTIQNDSGFRYINTLRAFMENRQRAGERTIEFKQIDLYVNRSPFAFLEHRVRQIQGERAVRKRPDARCLSGDWGVADR